MSCVEMGKRRTAPETTPEPILERQSRYGGIASRLGSWLLYAKNAPQIATIDQATPTYGESTMATQQTEASKATKSRKDAR